MTDPQLLTLAALATLCVSIAIWRETKRKARDQSCSHEANGDVIHVPFGARNSIHFGPNLTKGRRNVLRFPCKSLRHD